MSDAPRSPARLDLGGGGWALLASALVSIGLIAFALSGVFFGTPRVGDGRDPATYGFELDLPRDLSAGLAASGNPRDFLQPLDDPATLAASEVDAWNDSHRMRAVVSTDLVVGLVLNGESRAWPVPLLNVHEVIHDSLGGVPLCITWSPLTRSAAAFDRRIRGRERRFALTGLLLFGNMLLYDRTEQPPRSLWSQLAFRAVSGPAQQAGESFDPLPGLALCSWQAWAARHPGSTVALAPESDKQRIKETSYARWYAQRALPPGVTAEDPRQWKHPVVALRASGEPSSPWAVLGLPPGSEAAGFAPEEPMPRWDAAPAGFPGAAVSPDACLLDGDAAAWTVVPSCEGAWSAFHRVAAQRDR